MKQRKSFGSGILCVFEIIIGVLLLIDANGFTAMIITGIGIAMMLIGLLSVIKYFKTPAIEASIGQHLVKGIIALLFGAFCAFNSNWFIVTFPILTIVYGIVMLLAGIGKIQIFVDLLRMKKPRWYVSAGGALITIACAVIILNNPFTTTTALWMFTGITLIVESAIDLVSIITNRAKKETSTQNDLVVVNEDESKEEAEETE